ncbi:hypothetical protein CYG48_05570 [Neorhizobium sp. SOG26]|uniref:PAS domain-containing protein n=1 Tax=Neorhizobium sp. SOG26 TaxID=2060726 RepID=UPI000E597924|nr:PAS domain-containing protein [Neorhizobium sp. SOG26]AXV15218.1 hypothetical protein CYG48_05570 [Neorhizobium sp. SOG26]
MVTDLESGIVLVNRTFCDIVGYSEEELVEMRMADITHPDEAPLNINRFRRMVEGGGTGFRIETRYIRKDGQVVRISKSMSPVRSDNGDIVQAVAVVRNGAGRESVQDEACRLAQIIASSDVAIVSIDTDMNIQSWNRGAQKLYGYSPAEVLGRSIMMIVPPEKFDEECSLMRSIRRGETVHSHETIRVHKDGSVTTVSLTAEPIYDDNGLVVGISKIARSHPRMSG